MSIVKACIVGNSLRNTGKACDASMGPTAMFIAVPSSLKMDDGDFADPSAWITPLLHASKQNRVYPFFGNNAVINTITNSAEGDQIVTLDDGTAVFLRYGVYNRTYETIQGGLCYAKALQGLNKSGYRLIEIDNSGQAILHKNSDGTYSGMIQSFMYSPSPIMADLKSTPYKNRFQTSMTPTELVQFGEVFAGFEVLLDQMGLLDAVITDEGPSTTTILKIGVQTECAEADLVSQFGAALGSFVNNFVVTHKDTGVVVTPTAAAIVSGHVELTGTYVSGETYVVSGAAPSQWLTNGVSGYDAEDGGVEITIP